MTALDARTAFGRPARYPPLRVRNATISEALARLRAELRIVRPNDGFRPPQAVPVPVPTEERERNGACTRGGGTPSGHDAAVHTVTKSLRIVGEHCGFEA